MRILFITARLPIPNTKGDALRTHYFIRDLSAEHEVDVISFVQDEEERNSVDALSPYCRSVRTIYLPRLWSLFKMLLGIFSFQPFQVIYYSSMRMQLAIRKAMRAGRYDVVHVCPVRMMSYHGSFKGVPLVVDLVDSLSLNMKRRAYREKNGLKKLLFHFESWKMARYEAWVTQRYDHGAITSDVDRRSIRGNHIDVIRNGVDTQRFRPDGDATRSKDIDTIFTGNMNYFPNADAAANLAREIMPEIERRKEGVNLYLVGANPGRNVVELGDDSQTFVTGFVKDMCVYLNRSKVFVAPLSVGSGIQNKILEAMACGVPVVSSNRGNAGIGAQDGHEILLAERPEEFAEKVCRLLEDDDFREEIGRSARRFVAERFGWSAQASRLVNTYKKAINLHEMKEFEQSTGRVPIYFYDRAPETVVAEEVLDRRRTGLLTRLFDVTIALAGIVLSSPLWLLAAIAVKATDRGPVFFRQQRVGKNDRPFDLLKFRTMIVDAEAGGKPQFCREGDCRITSVGRFMRRSRIDELPQFLNVLRGDMSFIGPRPERPEFVHDFSKAIPLYSKRHAVKPGLTGWAQVKFSYTTTAEDTARKLQYDLYYIKNRSVMMNLSILLQTVSVVVTGKGAR